MKKVAIINNLYFEQHKSLTEIADFINTSVSYISKILRKDKRYIEEKNRRKKQNLRNRRDKQKQLIYAKRVKKYDIGYIQMKTQHEQDIRELSRSTIIGNPTLRRWCSSAYKYNKMKKAYVFDTETLLKPADFPLYIKA